MNNKVEYAIFYLFAVLSKLIGIHGQIIAGKILGVVIFYLIPIRKDVVIKNLHKAFPDFSDKQVIEVAKRNYIHFATLLFEILGQSSLSASDVKRRLVFYNFEEVHKKRAEGKPVIIFTAHFGNWELGGVALGLELGERAYVLAKPQRNKYVSDWLNKNREHFGNKVLPLGASIREVYTCIKEKSVLGVVGDQRGPESAERVLFMGVPTAVYNGAAVIAVKTNTPVFVSITVKLKDNSYSAHIEEIDFEKLSGDNDKKVTFVMQQYMDILSKHIKENPEQWFWMHNIWKY